MSGSFRALFLSCLSSMTGRPVMAVIPSREEAENLEDELVELSGEDVLFFPEGEEEEESPIIVNAHRTGSQMSVIRRLLLERPGIWITTPEGLVQRLPPPRKVRDSIVTVKPGETVDLYGLVDTMVTGGYARELVAERPGEISLRGGILDIFPFTGESPVRIEFFGNTVESMRTFDVETQRSTGKAESFTFLPAPVTVGPGEANLMSYCPADTLFFIEDSRRVLGKIHDILSGESFYPGTREDLDKQFYSFPHVHHDTFGNAPESVDMGARELPVFERSASGVRKHLGALEKSTGTILIACDGEEQMERLRDLLELEDRPVPGIQLKILPVQKGFVLEPLSLAVLTEHDLFGRGRRRRRRERFRIGTPIRELSALKKGDFIVHIDHGIGRYEGLEKISVSGIERECLVLGYQDSGRIYVPVENMERVQKYSGREGYQPVLNRLGGTEWERTKANTKKAVKKIARDLLALYSARKALPGHPFQPDSTWQKELEASFPYEETADQLAAVRDVRMDMENEIPMDRLICGDVGFGKTEVAVRAAFKAVNDGKQVVVLAPTTILAQQHFQTFQDRLSRFPVVVEVLSRFKTVQEQKDIIGRMERGEVDIIIGTHRLLSGDVRLRDFGMLIIDEEQRFGVRQKERLKSMKKTVDVLTLSATPIPRTLYLSMMGIRDMSVINTPPKDRLPIITEVVPFAEDIIAEAIERELERGGQIFFVHNRIKSIDAVAGMVKRIVPGARVAIGHGQMPAQELENVIMDFIGRKYDCLVSTLIIGSGVDMPNVNTLIVNRADRLGLSQLYQLRGRVGRSDKRAFAYLLTPPFHLLSEEAVRRLRTIEEFTELGSGFQIALRDLEIRGTGNLLGVEQSGFMDAVGYDLYTRLVNESVRELKEETLQAQPQPQAVQCTVELDVPAYIPDTYVPDESMRVNLYRRIASIGREEETGRFHEELQDRFGTPPEEVVRLLETVRIKLLAQTKGLNRVRFHEKNVLMTFDPAWIEAFASQELLSGHLRTITDKSPVPIRFFHGKSFGFRMEVPREERLAFTKKWLQRCG